MTIFYPFKKWKAGDRQLLGELVEHPCRFLPWQENKNATKCDELQQSLTNLSPQEN